MFISYFLFPNFNPIFFSLGPVSLHWYGVMYLLSFIFSIFILLSRINNSKNYWSGRSEELEHLLYVSFFAVLIGGRIGYVIFYHPCIFLENIFSIFKIWEGGMSFHGGLIGVIIVWLLLSYRKKYQFFQISDFIVPVVPFGLAAGRLGNFINGELYGRVAVDVPWGMFFPNTQEQDLLELLDHPQWRGLFNSYGSLPRHPSQLYEMFLEGILLFVIINLFVRKNPPLGSVSGLFLLLYGIFRVFVEFFREPDIHLGLFMGWISIGQILSIPMIIAGVIIVNISYGIFLSKNFLKD